MHLQLWPISNQEYNKGLGLVLLCKTSIIVGNMTITETISQTRVDYGICLPFIVFS